MMNPHVAAIVDFWFQRPPMEWIIAPAGLDVQIKSDFGDLVLKARRNELDDWNSSPQGSLALVVLLDQFSRNIFRGSPDAFGGDAKAQEIATKAVARDFDKQLSVIQASALYMALMQQENLVSVVAAGCLFKELKARCETDEENKWIDLGIGASKTHMKQLERFGRYPTRNALLGRKSTEAEESFLAEYKPSV